MSIGRWFGLGPQTTVLSSARDGGEIDATTLTRPRVKRNRQELAEVAQQFVTEHLVQSVAPPQAPMMWRAVTRFFELYDQRPIKEDRKGSGFHNLFWLYLTTHFLRPSLIVESGVRKGVATWMLRASAPDATIHGFDITLERLQYRDPSIHFHENDWAEEPLEPQDPRSSLCFFDDHVNQAMRIREAYERGFRLLVFDDCMPAQHITDVGLPPTPTVAMLMDGSLKPGHRFEWDWFGTQRRYEFRAQDTFDAKSLVSHWATYPHVGEVHGSRSRSFLTYVRLVA